MIEWEIVDSDRIATACLLQPQFFGIHAPNKVTLQVNIR